MEVSGPVDVHSNWIHLNNCDLTKGLIIGQHIHAHDFISYLRLGAGNAKPPFLALSATPQSMSGTIPKARQSMALAPLWVQRCLSWGRLELPLLEGTAPIKEVVHGGTYIQSFVQSGMIMSPKGGVTDDRTGARGKQNGWIYEQLDLRRAKGNSQGPASPHPQLRC